MQKICMGLDSQSWTRKSPIPELESGPTVKTDKICPKPKWMGVSWFLVMPTPCDLIALLSAYPQIVSDGKIQIPILILR